jgi:hypothetical protein
MTAEQHAALCAECAVWPLRAGEIQARYAVRSDEERAALDRHWRERMQGRDDLEELWRSHYRRYEQWFRQQPR